MPKPTAADHAQATRDLHNRIAQVEQPFLLKIRELETELEDSKKRLTQAMFKMADAVAQRDIAIAALDALIKYLATVKST